MNKKTLMVAISSALAVMLSPVASAVTHVGALSPNLHATYISASSATASLCPSTLSFQNRDFFRVTSAGVQKTIPLTVPAGSNFVVTEIEWSAYGGPSGTSPLAAGRTLVLGIGLVGPTTPQGGFPPNIFRSSLTLDANSALGRPGRSEQLTSGFVVGPGVSVCPNAIQTTPSFGATAYIDQIILRGYFTPI